MTLYFQNNLLLEHLSFGLPLVRLLLCIPFEKTHSTDERRQNLFGGYFCLLYLFFMKQRKGWKYQYVLLQEVNMKPVEEEPAPSIEAICMERCGLVFVFRERIIRLNHDEDVMLRRNVETLVSKARDTKSPWRWNILRQLHE